MLFLNIWRKDNLPKTPTTRSGRIINQMEREEAFQSSVNTANAPVLKVPVAVRPRESFSFRYWNFERDGEMWVGYTALT